jgi:outer membrane immunogenic protein
MLKYVAAALVAGTALTPAVAAAQDSPFSGPRVEAIVGYDSLRSGETEGQFDETVDGVGYGIGLGYDFSLGGVVIGAEAELSDSSGEQDLDETIDGVNYVGRFETGRDIYVGARIGVPVTPQTLLYVKGGYTNAAVEAGFESNNDVFEEDTTLDGWRVGGGIEQAIGSNAFAKLEYRYSNYNSLRIDDEVTGGNPLELDVDVDRHQVVAGFGLRF